LWCGCREGEDPSPALGVTQRRVAEEKARKLSEKARALREKEKHLDVTQRARNDSHSRSHSAASAAPQYYFSPAPAPARAPAPRATSHGGTWTGTYHQSRGSAAGRAIYEGPRGGHFYINANGNKTYVKK
jgi:hypothetical protein